MGIKEGTCKFYLTRGVDYKHNGSNVTAGHVLLKEPGMDHIKHYMQLRQMITRAQMELAKQAGEINKLRDAIGEEVKPLSEETERIEAEDMSEGLSLALQAAESVDIGKFIDTFEKMATMKGRSSVCLVDSETAMTHFIWGNLKPDDAFNMAVKWVSFFGMPSGEGGKTISGQPSESHTEPTEV